jgi:acetylornithine deacetylase
MRRREFLKGVLGPGALALTGFPPPPQGYGGPGRSPKGEGRRAASAPEIDRAELLELAIALCRIPSFTTEETDCARFLDGRLQELGFATELQEVDPGRFQCIARLRGTGGGESLMLNGHIDIDPLPSGLTRDPFSPAAEGNMFFGAGIGNMKAGVAAMIAAAASAKRAGYPRRGELVLACVVGELQGGAGTAHLIRSGVRTDAAIVTEPHGAANVVTKHAGVMQLAIHVLGRTAHISRKEQGVNAIVKAGKVAIALESLKLEGNPDPDLPALPLLNVGSILGGRGREVELRGPNIVPDFATLYVDVRFPNGMTPSTVIADLKRALDELAREDRELQYEIEFPMKPERRCLREVMMPFSIPPESPFVQRIAKHVAAVRGAAPKVGVSLPSGYSGNDTSHLQAAGIPSCLYGPAGAPDGPERYLWASIDEMMTCARVYAAMIAEM